METTDLLTKVRRIEIKTRALTNNIFAGEYHSAFKGRGMSFAEVREYQPGDDVRDIDWNVTARFNRPYVKVFEEERELTVMLLIDVSGSLDFGSAGRYQRDLATEIAATLLSLPFRTTTKSASSFSLTALRSSFHPKRAVSTFSLSSANCSILPPKAGSQTWPYRWNTLYAR